MQGPLTSVFVGRDAEVERVVALGLQATAGKGVVVLVEGEPGIGKTALLDAAVARYAAEGLSVRRGAAMELQRQVPFAAVCSWLDSDRGSDPVRALLRSGDRAGDGAATHEFAISEAILDLVDTWCAAGPVALVIDDVHWADRQSLAVLHRLCGVVDGLPLLLMLAARPLPRDTGFVALTAELAERRAPTLRLGALPEPATTELVRHMVGAIPGPGLMRQVVGAGGNPLYITELVACLLRDEAITVVADIADPTDSADDERPSASLAEAITQRLEFLSRSARQVLPMAAALGPTVYVAELAAVLDSPILEIWNVVTEATDGGLLTRADSELVFRHDLIRQVLADQLPDSLRAGLLRRAGQILLATDAPIERIAYYLLAGENEFDKPTLDWLVAVADKLIVRVPEIAVRLLQRAAGTADLGMRPILLRLHTQALLWNGRAVEAEALVRTALLSRPEDDIELRWLLMQACHAQGDQLEVVAVAEKTLVTPNLTDADAGRFHGMSGLHNFFLGRFDAAEAAGKRALAIGEATGNPIATGYGLLTLGALRFIQGYLDEALELSSRILAVFNSGFGTDQFDPYVVHAHCLIELDRLTDAEAFLYKAIGHNRRINGVYLGTNLSAQARLYLLDGRWDDAMVECTTGLAVPDILGYTPILQSLAALIGIHRGTFQPDPDDILPPTDQFGSSGYAQFYPWVKALLLETRGDPRGALDLLVDAQRRLVDGMAAPALYYIYPDIARLAADLGDEDAARTVVAASTELVARCPTPSRIGTALLCRGVAERDPARLLTAAAEFRQAGRPLYEAQAYENAAVLFAADGHGSDARSALDAAVELYTGLGASWDTARAVARMRPYGIRRGVRGPRNRPKSGRAALTDTERKVAALVAEGFSNSDIAAQMFLSRRTIQSHVSNILAKLGIASRHDIAAALSGK
ncbi:helix-turn-helix transcriptional regulator [Nocardia vinacea]|uniref:helix-turn-helix transcriptional regulator n=1 Tax=Nocardia vinacea TaxID=96468 RepID=UPI0002D81FD3|nr:AAA family ATPase [Nocardia vinacea]